MGLGIPFNITSYALLIHILADVYDLSRVTWSRFQRSDNAETFVTWPTIETICPGLQGYGTLQPSFDSEAVASMERLGFIWVLRNGDFKITYSSRIAVRQKWPTITRINTRRWYEYC